MDHMTTKKSETWASQMDWSAVSSQSSLLNPVSGQNPASVSHISPASLFANATFDPPQLMDAREKLRPLQAGNQAQMGPLCASPSCVPPPSTQPSFQSPSSPGSFPSIQVVAAYSLTSLVPPAAPQWTDSANCHALNDSEHPDKDAAAVQTPGMTKRSMILHQRSLLLKQLSELDKLLESLPPEDNVRVKSPPSGAQANKNSILLPLIHTHGMSAELVSLCPQSPLSMDESATPQSETPHKSEPEWYASSAEPSPASPLRPSTPPQPAPSDGEPRQEPPTNDERRHEEDDSDELTDDSACAADATEPEKPSAQESSDEGSDFLQSDDGDVSDALSDLGEDIAPRSARSPRGATMFLRSKKQPCSVPIPTEPREAKTKWSRLSNVKVCAMKEGQKSCKRVYRRNHCLFCSKPVIKMSRHLQRQHSHKEEVSAALRFPKGSRERQKLWNRLTNEGNYAHNKQVLQTGEGQLAARKRPTKTGQAQDFLHCLYCRGLYRKKRLACHMKRCPERQKRKMDEEPRIGKERVETRCALEAMGDLGISAGLRAILSHMIYDDVTRLIISEPVLLDYGEDMLARYGSDHRRQEYMRQNLRQMARLVLEAWKRTPLRRLEDFFDPDSFPHVVAAVNVLAGYDPAARTYSAPSLATKLGYSLQQVCRIVQERALERRDFALAESAKNFLAVYRKRWAKMISSGALSVLRKTKRKSREKFLDVQDVKRLIFHLEKVYHLAEEKLHAEPSAETYDILARTVLARIILLNRRQNSEVSNLPLTALKSVKKPDPQENLDLLVSELERSMCRVFSRMEIRSTCGRMVPVFLKPVFLSALELLVEVREACGVPAKNPFLLGRPHTLSAYRGSVCVQMFVRDSGVRDSEALTSAGIRKQHTAMLQVNSLDPTESDLILGPNNQVKSLRNNVGVDPDSLNAAPVASWNHCESFAGLTDTHATNSTAPRRSAKAGSPINKHKWSDCEVAAVEKHMMSLIRNHKVPQKLDCLRCLDAEPRALSRRSWKGVKDYVRNRITALKRQDKSSKH
ncbi:uncharacterized protein LOC133154390 isoform X1 [Syngnathus typhle]|uniref:uncharacterized protein LOC133154390 isoform X1 n=2 Tax=Syngnathus typhle TaxID=161592 RepID=UPI002A6A2498|nr:uncharacterized protein LOC133154390 isoform X1 [Syngnathus typhle]